MKYQIEVALYDRGLAGALFSYTVTTDQDLVGSVITVPFGKTHARGLVVLQHEELGNAEHILEIEEVTILHQKLLGSVQCKLLYFIGKRYLSPMHKVLRLFIPEKIWTDSYKPKRDIHVSLRGREEYDLNPRMKALLAMEAHLSGSRFTKKEVLTHVSSQTYKKALEMGMIQEAEGSLLPTYISKETVEPRSLTVEQKEIFDAITKDPTRPYLIHGVTGAGKTEIYLHLALHYAKQGKQTLVVVPEIVLTPQLRTYFSNIFGSRISIFHSKLSEGERLQEWTRVKEGESIVVLGSRSAFFAPFHNLGLIVIDEEHEWTYKNEQNPRYYLHTLALYMHEMTKETGHTCSLVLGSATPRVETYARTFSQKHPIHLLTLDKKIFEQTQVSTSLENN